MHGFVNGIKAVVFDLDGVIVSTDELHYKAWSSIAQREGLPFDRNINDRLRGVSRMDSLEIILGESSKVYSKEEKLFLANEKNIIYRRLLDGLSPNDVPIETKEVLKRLRANGVKMAIGSSSCNAPLILERTGLADSFDAVSDGNCISRSKPDPEVFVNAAELLDVDACLCAVVDDSEAGLEAARRCGMTACAIGPSCGSVYADFDLKCLSSLIELFGLED